MKRDLIYVPIEPLEERYTAQWYKHFPVAFAEHFNVIVIDGEPLQETVKVGTFLDINSTIHYKATQLRKIAALFDAGKIADGTRFFFGDIEFWGIESIRLMADMNRVNIKLTGFLHAASYTKGDAFEIAAPYQRYTEVGWIAAFDTVFVGSAYHRGAVVERRLVPLGADHLQDRLVVAGNPMFEADYPAYSVNKKQQVVLTNRFDAEKHPDRTLALFAAAKAMHPDWTFVVTTGRKTFTSNDPKLVKVARYMEAEGIIEIRAGLTKDEYHRILAESLVMVSHSPEENFGYCIAEAALYDCQPLLLNCASHPDMVAPLDQPDAHLFTHSAHALAQLEYLMANPRSTKAAATRFFSEPIETFIKAML